MATLGPNVTTLSDIRSRLDPNGMIAKVVEVLDADNEILNDIPWMEGNLPTGNQTTMRSSIATINTRALNSGADFVKTSTKQVVDTCCILEANSEVDIDVMKLQNNPQGYRLSEDLGIAEGFRQKCASLMIYGDTNSNPEHFNGLAVRYASLSGAAKGNSAYQIIDAGGTGSVNTSAYFVNWGENEATGIFPQNSNAGLTITDNGKQRILDASGKVYWGFSTNMQWKVGLAVKNLRSVARVCNIDTTALQTWGTGSDTSPNLAKFLFLAMQRLPKLGANTVCYVDDLVYQYLGLMLGSKNLAGTGLYITRQEMMNAMPALRINGVLVKKVDAILNTESRIV